MYTRIRAHAETALGRSESQGRRVVSDDPGVTIEGERFGVHFNAAAVAVKNGEGAVEPAPAEPAPPKERKPIIAKDDDGLRKALDQMGYEYRFNLRSSEFELRHFEWRGWRELHERKDAWLRFQIAKRFRFPSKDNTVVPAHFGRVSWHDVILAVANVVEMDPFVDDYLIQLPEHDPDNLKLTGWVRDVFQVEEEEQGTAEHSLVSWASRAPILGAVARAFVPGYKLDEMVVMVGGQGSGKSSVWEMLLPPEYQDQWFVSGFSFFADEKARVEKLLGAVFTEASEMTGATRADMESIKSFITTRHDKIRLAYRRDPERIPRRATLVGTSNDDQPLPNDHSGNRRFVPIRGEAEDGLQPDGRIPRRAPQPDMGRGALPVEDTVKPSTFTRTCPIRSRTRRAASTRAIAARTHCLRNSSLIGLAKKCPNVGFHAGRCRCRLWPDRQRQHGRQGVAARHAPDQHGASQCRIRQTA